ncbi:MAG TPA: Hsp70 family protein [Actinophytocola sp.]|uniref:Hsp70 family protein n=1 Tax=Actinophytocola sp. TaxID=1872138 RepID=UPI002DB84054|nr:Hsp70 family protein [Actinophytocola sp.]HEU5469344.1 Hsp70 family protein [Actinophytocola sp.]
MPFALPSVVFAQAGGALLVGDEAERLAPADPGRVARQFKRRIGDGTPLRLGDAVVPAEALAARLVARAVGAAAERERAAATRIAVTHPAGWGGFRVAALRGALSAVRIEALLLPEPHAAALAHDARERVAPGGAVAVYDLGGTGCRLAVLRRADDGFVLAGPPEEVEVGGLDFDEAVFEHVRGTVGAAWDALDPADPAVLAGVARLRRECTAAKEALSGYTDVSVPVTLPGIDTEVRLTRVELEDMIRPAIEETAGMLLRVLGTAGVAPADLAAVLLAGGSARIPLVTQVVSERLGRPVAAGADPAGLVAAGAALAARGPQVQRTQVGLWPANWTPPPVAAPEPLPQNSFSERIGPAPAAPERRGPLGRFSRTAVTAVVAAALGALAVTSTMAMVMNRLTPADAGAETVTEQTSQRPVTDSPVSSPVRAEQPGPARTSTSRRAPQTSAPQPTRSTPPRNNPGTTRPPAPTTATTTTTTGATPAPAGPSTTAGARR